MSSNGIHASILCGHANESGEMESIIRGPGLLYFLCFVCSWPLLRECPGCYWDQLFFRDSLVLSDVCPIILSDTMVGVHMHCVTWSVPGCQPSQCIRKRMRPTSEAEGGAGRWTGALG